MKKESGNNSELDEIEKGDVIGWSSVNKIHRSRNGIYQKRGRLVSLLTDLGRISPWYPDYKTAEDTLILYTGSGRRGDQKRDLCNRSLIDATRSKEPVPLFCKLDVNRWQYLGYWIVADAQYVHQPDQKRMIWQFSLKPFE